MTTIEINSGVLFLTDPSGQYILENEMDATYLIEDFIDYEEYVEHYESKGIKKIILPIEAVKWFKTQEHPYMNVDPNCLDYGVAIRVPKGKYEVKINGFYTTTVEIVISPEVLDKVKYEVIGYVGINGGSFSILDGDNLTMEKWEPYHFQDDIKVQTGDSTYRVVGVYNGEGSLLRIRIEYVFDSLYDEDDVNVLDERMENKDSSPYEILDDFLIRKDLVNNQFTAISKGEVLKRFGENYGKRINELQEKIYSISIDEKTLFDENIDAFEEWLSER